MRREGAEGLAAVDRRSPTAHGGIRRKGEWSGQAGIPSVGLGSVRSVADSRQGILDCDARAQR